MTAVLLDCAEKQCISLPSALATQIAVTCKGNMRKALLILEAMYVQQYIPRLM